jgi:hypothetical protein
MTARKEATTAQGTMRQYFGPAGIFTNGITAIQASRPKLQEKLGHCRIITDLSANGHPPSD